MHDIYIGLAHACTVALVLLSACTVVRVYACNIALAHACTIAIVSLSKCTVAIVHACNTSGTCAQAHTKRRVVTNEGSR